MRLNILSDANWESRVDLVLNALSDFNYRSYFQERDYGTGLIGVTVVFMCRDPALNFKQRIRLSKKEKKLYIDLMLDLSEMTSADQTTRQRLVAGQLLKEVPEIISRYKIEDFDRSRFLADFQAWIIGTEWL